MSDTRLGEVQAMIQRNFEDLQAAGRARGGVAALWNSSHRTGFFFGGDKKGEHEMPVGRLIRLSAARQIEHPLYVVAVADPTQAIKTLENARVLNGCTPSDLGPISERLIEKLRLQLGQFIQIKAGKQE